MHASTKSWSFMKHLPTDSVMYSILRFADVSLTTSFNNAEEISPHFLQDLSMLVDSRKKHRISWYTPHRRQHSPCNQGFRKVDKPPLTIRMRQLLRQLPHNGSVKILDCRTTHRGVGPRLTFAWRAYECVLNVDGLPAIMFSQYFFPPPRKHIPRLTDAHVRERVRARFLRGAERHPYMREQIYHRSTGKQDGQSRLEYDAKTRKVSVFITRGQSCC